MRGFTTLELLIVGLMATVLFALAIPGVRRSVAATRLKNSANELQTELNFGRSMSVSRNTSYIINIDTSSRTFQLQDPLSSAFPRSPRILEKGVSFSGLPEEAITFFPRGHSSGGSIVLANEFREFIRLDVRPSGMVEMQNYGTESYESEQN